MEITTIGLALAKNVFQVHAVDASAMLSCERRFVALNFCPPLRIWGRALSALSYVGHEHLAMRIRAFADFLADAIGRKTAP